MSVVWREKILPVFLCLVLVVTGCASTQSSKISPISSELPGTNYTPGFLVQLSTKPDFYYIDDKLVDHVIVMKYMARNGFKMNRKGFFYRELPGAIITTIGAIGATATVFSLIGTGIDNKTPQLIGFPLLALGGGLWVEMFEKKRVADNVQEFNEFLLAKNSPPELK